MKFTKTVIAALALGASSLAIADGIEWSGFGSLYYSQAFDSQFLIDQQSNSKPNFTEYSLLGFNVGSKLSDNMSVASQLILSGAQAQSTNFNMYAQWAYLNYRLTDSMNFKIGRQLWPVLISSEYQRVHQLLPQVNVPYTAYALIPFVGFDGVSLNKNLNVGVGDLTVGAYAGNPKLNAELPAGLNLDFQKVLGARVTLDGSGWRIHATYNKIFSKVEVDAISYGAATGGNGVPVHTMGKAETNSDVTSFGFRYDKHNIVTWGEMSYLKSPDKADLTLKSYIPSTATAIATTTKKLFEKTYGGYLLVGYRIGAWLPTFTAAQGTTYLGLPTNSTTNTKYEGKTSSYHAAISYQVNDQATARFAYIRTYVPSAGGGWYDVTQSATDTKKHGDAVKAGFDFIF